MLCHVDIISVNPSNCGYIESRLTTSKGGPVRFERWSQHGKWSILRPEFSIIDVTDLDWQFIAQIANACAGNHILLWGTDTSICGLEILRTDFSAIDLLRHLNIGQRSREMKGGTVSGNRGGHLDSSPVTIPLAI